MDLSYRRDFVSEVLKNSFSFRSKDQMILKYEQHVQFIERMLNLVAKRQTPTSLAGLYLKQGQFSMAGEERMRAFEILHNDFKA